MNRNAQIIRASAIADGRGSCAPGAILLREGRIVAAGSPASIGEHRDCSVLDLPNAVVLPALVNAHCHLDLSHIGPVKFDGDFSRWADSVRQLRPNEAGRIDEAVRLGARLSRAGGTAIVGDIAGARSLRPIAAQREAGLPGVNFIEVFGLGKRQADAAAFMQRVVADIPAWSSGVALGLQPHAPYSCGLDVYRAAAGMGCRLATHLAETPEELAFVADADGPLAQMIKRIGVWDDTISGSGLHPVDHLAAVLGQTPFVAAHANYIEIRHIEMMAGWPISIAYCPRASAYFGHSGHRYREMLSAGINVALGTDSILCLDTPNRLSVLDDMRLLHRRDGADPVMLVRMGTINGAKALGFDSEVVALSPGHCAGLIAVTIDPGSATDPLRQVMLSDEAPRWIFGPTLPDDAWLTGTAMEALSLR